MDGPLGADGADGACGGLPGPEGADGADGASGGELWARTAKGEANLPTKAVIIIRLIIFLNCFFSIRFPISQI